MSGEKIQESLRVRKMLQTKRALQQHALRLFRERGYEATTVEDIAAAANVSDRTFFRYFPTKESVLFDDDYEPVLSAAIEFLPRGEDAPIDLLKQLVRSVVGSIYEQDRDELLERSRLTMKTPALRGRLMEDVLQMERMVGAAIARATGQSEEDFAVQTMAAACVGAIRVAFERWLATDGAVPLPQLIVEALEALQRGLGRVPEKG